MLRKLERFFAKRKWFEEPKEDGSLQQPIEAELPGEKKEPKLDTNSPTWQFLKGYLEDELIKMRKYNDNPKHDAEKTAVTRGDIRRIKRILELPDAVEEHHSIINHHQAVLEGEDYERE